MPKLKRSIQLLGLGFCGFELKRHDDQVSLMVGQRSYTAELLNRHEDVTPQNVSYA